jgi:hypothetical protein
MWKKQTPQREDSGDDNPEKKKVSKSGLFWRHGEHPPQLAPQQVHFCASVALAATRIEIQGPCLGSNYH